VGKDINKVGQNVCIRYQEEGTDSVSQSVSILGSRLSCIFTEQRRHYSTLLGPEKLVG
jgi:hypothetical protein